MRFLLKLIGILAFCAVSFYALFLAYGYQYDVARQDIKKTSIIDLTGHESAVEVTFNGKIIHMGNLPYQIKDVLPGTAELLLKKKDFLPWKRTLNVKADFVSKITDILFVPGNISAWTKELISFVDDVHVVAGDEFLVITKPNQPYLTVIFLNDDGTFRQKEIPLHHENLERVEIMSSGQLLAHFQDNVKESIFLDEEVSSFGEKIRPDVTDFAIAKKKIYYLSSGMLFSSDFADKQVALLDQSFQKFYTVKTIENKNYSFLVFQTTPPFANDSAFSLYLVNPDSSLKLVAERIFPSVFLNGLNQILFSDFDKQLFFYDPRLDEKKLLHSYNGDFGLIGWFDDEHFLFRGRDHISVSDLSISNVFPLLTNINRFEDMFFFAKNRTLFYLDKNKLNMLNWGK